MLGIINLVIGVICLMIAGTIAIGSNVFVGIGIGVLNITFGGACLVDWWKAKP